METKHSILIYSGGLDSTTLLYEYRSEVALALSFDYGSNHAERELACAAWHCQHLGIEHLTIPLDFIKRYFQSALTAGPDAIPDAAYATSNMLSTVVPFRNGIMLSIACGIAESRGLKQVLIANHGGDHAIYPDCRPDFIAAMSQATQQGTYAGISVCAPYTYLSKADIVSRGNSLGVDYSHTYSCYKGSSLHCGTCATCLERREAFASANVTDPTQYLV